MFSGVVQFISDWFWGIGELFWSSLLALWDDVTEPWRTFNPFSPRDWAAFAPRAIFAILDGLDAWTSRLGDIIALSFFTAVRAATIRQMPKEWNNRVVKQSDAFICTLDVLTITGPAIIAETVSLSFVARFIIWLRSKVGTLRLIRNPSLELIMKKFFSRWTQLFRILVLNLVLAMFRFFGYCVLAGVIGAWLGKVNDDQEYCHPLQQKTPRKKFALCTLGTHRTVGRIRRREAGGSPP